MFANSKKIYLDHSATTPLDPKVLEAMMPFLTDKFGNPSSIHSFGQEALTGVDEARQILADFLNCQTSEIIFTSGATEANNLAVRGLIKALKKRKGDDYKMHIITSSIEHSAILEPCRELERQGIEVTYLPVDKKGIIKISALEKAIKDNTVLVSIMYVNNEVGSVQPIRKIGKLIKKINEKRDKEWRNTRVSERGERPEPIYFHTDAVQAVNFFNCDVVWNYIDMLSLSGHKIYGPKGIGALYVREGVPIYPVELGGHQERNRRSGTLNVPGIVGLGAAIKLLGKRREKGQITTKQEKYNKKISQLRDKLVKGILTNIPQAKLNTDLNNATPAHANFIFFGVEGESVLLSLDLEGIAVSTGSACASANLEASHVLLAMGIKKEIAHSSIRFTLGRYATSAEINKVIKILPNIIKKLRKISTEWNE